MSSQWVTRQGDCDESITDDNNDGVLDGSVINEGAAEVCSALNASVQVDEDCDGAFDDDDTSLSNGFAYYADNDTDGYPNQNAPNTSCQAQSTGDILVYYYEPTAGHNSECICPTSSCDIGCQILHNGSLSGTCTADTGAVGFSCDVASDPYNPSNSEFEPFQLYAFDCDDTSAAIYPTADEDCDGVRNDCVYEGDGVPLTEIDLDDDAYVECGFTGGTWLGATAPNVGADCSPSDSKVFPFAHL